MDHLLRSQIEQLAADQKLELLHVLSESIEAAGVPGPTDAQCKELDRRIARYEQNPSAVVPWEDVRQRILKKK